MLWHNFADLFGMRPVLLHSYRPLFFHFIYLDSENFSWACILSIMPCTKTGLAGKQQKIISVENFDGENVDELMKIH